MNETDENLRKSTFDTLSLLASPKRQRAFAATVRYDDYVAEFSCWWFDSFLPDNPLSADRYSQAEFATLCDFSAKFEGHLTALTDRPRDIEDVLADPIWAKVVADAIAAEAVISTHA